MIAMITYNHKEKWQCAMSKIVVCEFVCWTPERMHRERILFDSTVFDKIKPKLDTFFCSSKTTVPQQLNEISPLGNALKRGFAGSTHRGLLDCIQNLHGPVSLLQYSVQP